MTWGKYGNRDDMWTWSGDEERHLLVLVGTELREYHEVPDGAPTVHVYTPSVAFGTDAQPLDGAQHVATYTVAGNFAPWVRVLDDRELIEWIMAASYVKATGDAA